MKSLKLSSLSKMGENLPSVFIHFNGYVLSAGGVQEMHRLSIVQPGMKSRSRSVTVNGSGQGASFTLMAMS